MGRKKRSEGKKMEGEGKGVGEENQVGRREGEEQGEEGGREWKGGEGIKYLSTDSLTYLILTLIRMLYGILGKYKIFCTVIYLTQEREIEVNGQS